MIKKILLYTLLALVTIFVAGLLIPQNLQMPVVGAGCNDYKTFWYEMWKTSTVRKGIDVFAKKERRNTQLL